jgi:hypothetical protein
VKDFAKGHPIAVASAFLVVLRVAKEQRRIPPSIQEACSQERVGWKRKVSEFQFVQGKLLAANQAATIQN